MLERSCGHGLFKGQPPRQWNGEFLAPPLYAPILNLTGTIPGFAPVRSFNELIRAKDWHRPCLQKATRTQDAPLREISVAPGGHLRQIFVSAVTAVSVIMWSGEGRAFEVGPASHYDSIKPVLEGW